MKRNFLKSLLGILAFLTFAGLGFAQEPTVTFNPPSGTAVKSGTVVTFTLNNPATVWDDPQTTCYWATGTSLDAIENPNMDNSNVTNTGSFTVTETKKAVKVAVIVKNGSPSGSDEYPDNEEYGFVLKCFSATYTIDENAGDVELSKADNPVFAPVAGNVLAGTKIKITPINETYIAAGETKPESGYIRNNNVNDDVVEILTINENKTIWAFTKKDGFSNSDTISATYTIVPAITLSPESGTEVEAGTEVTITLSELLGNKTVWYAQYASMSEAQTATDGWKDPNSIYDYLNSSSVAPKITEGKTVLRIGIFDGEGDYKWERTDIYAEYTIKKDEPLITLNPESGTEVEAGTEVTITLSELLGNKTVWYAQYASMEEAKAATEGWNNPDEVTRLTSSTVKPKISEGKTVLRLGIFGDIDWERTDIYAEYTIKTIAPAKPEAPVITPKGGTVLVNTPVTIAKGTADSIFYTTGTGATATFTKSLEDVKVTITGNTVLRAFAMKEGVCSDTVTERYKVPAGPTDPTKASVRLVVDGTNCIHTSRNQYQVLLDATHTITNYFKADLETGSYFADAILSRLYGESTLTVPDGITADNAATSGIETDEEAVLLVEPGTYDIFLLQSYDAHWLSKDIVRGIYNGYNGPEGNKYFSLDDLVLEAGKSYVFNVTFDETGAHGELLLPTDLKLVNILGEDKPSCELDSIRLSLKINNAGLTTVDSYTAWCTNGKDTVKETVANAIDAGQSVLYTFTKKLALKAGESTTVKAGIIVEGDAETANNNGQYVAHHNTVSTLPAQIAPATMISANANDWSIDENNNAIVASLGASSPIFSPCFKAETNGKFRVSYEYICSRYAAIPGSDFIVNNVDVYEIRVGKTSENYTEWQSVLVDSSRVGSSNYSEFEPKDVVFDLEEAGDYAFCIIPKRVNDNNNLKFRNLSVEQMSSQSARFNAFNILSPRIVPQDWGTATYKAEVAVENRGLENLENATLAISVNGKVVKNETFSLTTAEKVKTLSVDVPVEGFKKGDKMKFSADVLVENTSVGNANNAVPAEITISDNTAAFDYLTECAGADNLQVYRNALIGLIFPVVEKDTLTAISCGWAIDIEDNMMVGLAIHKVTLNENGVVLGDALHEEQVRRGLTAGLNTYTLQHPFLLEVGNYFISVEQLEGVNFGLAVDKNPEGGFYSYDKAEKSWKYFTDAGYPAIRAVFGSDGVLLNKDAAITAISKPIAGGIFAENEPIVVSVCNNSYKAAEIPVYVRVDNTVLEPKTVSVKPYHTEEVSFTANLAAAGQNRNITITAFTALSGDEDHSNDTLRKNVLSMVPADPYRMDFESCLDFATEGLNPAWTSVSLDKSPVMPLRHVLEDYTFQYIEFPGSETDLGFITFNPLETEPSMVLFDFYNECRSHSGQRFGVSLGITNENAAKNDWLISPKLKMPSNNTQLSMWVKSFDRVYKESYEIWISEGSGDPTSEDFIRLYPGEDEEALLAPTKWTQAVFNLSRYNGKEIHVAIRCNSDDAPMFMIDDIVIGENVSNEEEPQADFRLTVYPNPAKEMVSLISPDAAINAVAIFNLSGHMVHQSANNLNTDNYRYNASALTSGMYFVRVTTNKGTAIRKFVIR